MAAPKTPNQQTPAVPGRFKQNTNTRATQTTNRGSCVALALSSLSVRHTGNSGIGKESKTLANAIDLDSCTTLSSPSSGLSAAIGIRDPSPAVRSVNGKQAILPTNGRQPQVLSRECPGSVPDPGVSRKCPGSVPGVSRECPGRPQRRAKGTLSAYTDCFGEWRPPPSTTHICFKRVQGGGMGGRTNGSGDWGHGASPGGTALGWGVEH